MPKQWKLLPKIKKESVSQFPDINPVCLQLLFNREINTQEKIDEFFNSDYLDDIHDPYLLKDMKTAVKRIYRAIKKQEEVLLVIGIETLLLIFYILYLKIIQKNLELIIEDFI